MRDDDDMDPVGSGPDVPSSGQQPEPEVSHKAPDDPPSEPAPEPAMSYQAPADPPPPPPPAPASEPAATKPGSLWDRIKAAIGL